MAEKQEQPVALPSTEPVQLAKGITLQPPLSRKGHGPGLIIVTPTSTPQPTTPDFLPPLQKWAEESFVVVEIRNSAFEVENDVEEAFAVAERGLEQCASREGGKIGLVVYDASLWDVIKPVLSSKSNIVAVVVYGGASGPALERSSTPLLYHLAGKDKPRTLDATIAHEYPKAESPLFAFPGHEGFHYSSESISHTRNLTFLKKHIGGPYFDLEAIWDEHTHFEFAVRSVEQTMGTMVQEPYMTGGIGRERLSNFYRHHFIFNNPDDTELELVSRTVGIDRVVDEFVFSFTHNMVIDWLIPGIPPTGRQVRVPFTSVVNIRGDRLYHEHIGWDQASVLVQLGLMPEYLPFPYALPDGTKPAEGKRFEYKVPAAGADSAKKILDRNSVPSNEMFRFKIRELDNYSTIPVSNGG
ncbi:hypothetical protein LSUE1_G003387 [Lachnellula suecica]|uniref:Carboxymethylenebutenolidase n=1 Tax=Lachnellula suecica TaxID=602035 RepID=A0A8T9CD54_9HELO|nr:hypothetical protein LSUE1_G003387 [Lachnellula suecica]